MLSEQLVGERLERAAPEYSSDLPGGDLSVRGEFERLAETQGRERFGRRPEGDPVLNVAPCLGEIVDPAQRVSEIGLEVLGD
jgi:hypothetical protein